MKKEFFFSHTFIFIVIVIALVLLSIAVINPSQPTQDSPPTQEPDLELQVGSTDEITVLAFIISSVILLPLIASGALKRKK